MHLLQSVVEQLARLHDGPSFIPHITLLSGLRGDEQSLVAKTHRLADEVEELHIELAGPEAGTTFFQCVYMRVFESDSLLQARQAAGDTFGLPATDYLPHLSLYYGPISDEQRAKIMAEVPDQARCNFAVSAIELIRASSDRPSDWHCVERAPLDEQGISSSR